MFLDILSYWFMIHLFFTIIDHDQNIGITFENFNEVWHCVRFLLYLELKSNIL